MVVAISPQTHNAHDSPEKTSWLGLARRRDVVARATKTALLVGTILIAINYFDLLIGGDVTLKVLLKMLLTVCVPYCVATYASVAAIRQAEASE